ncbi:MAG: hypothetical protein Q7T53_01100 [Deltaproteobacteria bacterium]|nr:hypothetical protein [Deltaproteobacteria bacterium]
MTRNKESSTIGKFVSQIRWEKGDGNYQRATVSALNVGRYFPGGRRCSITLQINHTDEGWKWSTVAFDLKKGREGIEDSLEASQEAAIAALPDIWSDLRDLTIKDLVAEGEGEPPKEPSWNIVVKNR